MVTEKTTPLPFQIGAVTDEFSPDNLDRALGAMADLGMTFAELRVVNGKNIIDHTDAEVDEVRARVEARGMRVLSIASPVLKCTLPDAPPVSPDIQQDMFSASFSLADQAQARGLVIGIENEHACNIATGVETARLLAAVDHPALQVIWDPANALVAGETPYPQGYQCIPLSRIAHVHAKDCTVTDHVP